LAQFAAQAALSRERGCDPSANRAIDARELDVDQIEELMRIVDERSKAAHRPRI